MTYSTSEQKTLDIFIGDKLIYQITVPFTVSATSTLQTFDTGMTNIKDIVSCYGSCFATTSQVPTLPATLIDIGTATYLMAIQPVINADGSVSVQYANTTGTITVSGYLTFRYTKIVD